MKLIKDTDWNFVDEQDLEKLNEFIYNNKIKNGGSSGDIFLITGNAKVFDMNKLTDIKTNLEKLDTTVFVMESVNEKSVYCKRYYEIAIDDQFKFNKYRYNRIIFIVIYLIALTLVFGGIIGAEHFESKVGGLIFSALIVTLLFLFIKSFFRELNFESPTRYFYKNLSKINISKQFKNKLLSDLKNI